MNEATPALAGWEAQAAPAAATRTAPQNWAFLAFVFVMPLQNLYTQYLPKLPGGINFLNLMFVASLIGAWKVGGRLVRGPGVNGWTLAYLAMSVLALVVGLSNVPDGDTHVNILKDQAIAIAFLFLAQMSATDETAVRRLLLASLLPRPYMMRVTLNQNAAVSSWHYSHDLRVSGTFSELGANEFGAWCVTAALLSLALALAVRAPWKWRAFFAAASVAAGTGVVLSYSRTAYVAILLGIAVVLLLHRGGIKLLAPAIIGVMLLPAVLPPAVMERFGSIEVEEGKRDESTEHRFAFWHVAGEQFAKRPILGSGFHTFHHSQINPFQTDTHNFFLRELTEKGIVGAVVLLGLFWSMGRLAWAGVRGAAPGTWTRGLALGMAGAFVALICGNSFGDRFTHYPMIAHFWLYLGLLLRSIQLQAARP
jgi:O-antigen ligase